MSRCFCNYKSVKRILQIRPWLAGTEMQLDQLKRDEFLRSAVRHDLAARHTRAAAGNAGCRFSRRVIGAMEIRYDWHRADLTQNEKPRSH